MLSGVVNKIEKTHLFSDICLFVVRKRLNMSEKEIQPVVILLKEHHIRETLLLNAIENDDIKHFTVNDFHFSDNSLIANIKIRS